MDVGYQPSNLHELAWRTDHHSTLVSGSGSDNSNVDRTLRTVFTHDHFGPSTHQQAGLYAGLVVEPQGFDVDRK